MIACFLYIGKKIATSHDYLFFSFLYYPSLEGLIKRTILTTEDRKRNHALDFDYERRTKNRLKFTLRYLTQS